MPLIPNIPLTDGQDWTGELANQAFNQVFDDQTQYLGHQARLTDDSLSNAPGMLKARLSALEIPLRVSVTSGLTVAYTTGVVSLPTGVLATIPSGAITVANNATSFIWVNTSGVVETGLTPPTIRLLLARVVASAGVISVLEDTRSLSIAPVRPVASSIRAFGGSSILDKVCTNGETLTDGNYYFRNFTVPSGVSITIESFAKIICSGNVLIQGTINVTSASNGGNTFASGLVTSVNLGGNAGSGLGGGAGSAATGGAKYSYAALPYGSGGGAGMMAGSSASAVNTSGGAGGGGIWIEASGTVICSGTINADGAQGILGFILGGTAMVTGGGGGSGGLIYLSSLLSVTCTGTAILSAKGAVGSIGQNTTGSNIAVGGGGGGGGWIVLASPNNNTTGATLLVTGGAGGSNAGSTGQTLGGGAGGGFGGSGGQGAGSVATVGQAGKIVSLSFSPIG